MQFLTMHLKKTLSILSNITHDPPANMLLTPGDKPCLYFVPASPYITLQVQVEGIKIVFSSSKRTLSILL